MSIRLGDKIISGVSRETKLNAHSLLDFKWTDHILNEMSWLRADTFSWQSGDVYTSVYNELLSQSEEWWETHTSKEIENGIYFIRTSKGYKICDPDQEQNIINAYNSTGVAWFYILDKSNRRFKLPRTKYGFTGLRDGVGNYVPESLPNIKGSFSVRAGVDTDTSQWTGGFYYEGRGITTPAVSQTGNTQDVSIGFDASRSSSTYKDNAPVQQRATQMYLYFYVGEFSQTAIEQTAGITTEVLSGKADTSASNFNSQGKSYISGWGMPSDRYIDLTLGATGSVYTAPANGYFSFAKTASASGQYANIICMDNNNIILYGVEQGSVSSNTKIRLTIPVKKGHKVTIGYNLGGTTDFLRFIYAEGEENV